MNNEETRVVLQGKLREILGAEYAGLAEEIEEELYQYYLAGQPYNQALRRDYNAKARSIL